MTMSIDALRPNKSDGTTDENDALTMAQIENALHQRPGCDRLSGL